VVSDPAANGGARFETVSDIDPGGKVQVVEYYTRPLLEIHCRAVSIERTAKECRTSDLDEAKYALR